MKRFLVLSCLVFITQFSIYSQSIRDWIENDSISLDSLEYKANQYFKIKGTGKGSGYKPYQRWLSDNKSRYYPEGDRLNTNPYFVSDAYEQFTSILQKVNKQNTKLSSENAQWFDWGPSSVDSITDHHNSGLGRVETFWVHPEDENLLYLGTRSGGFWRSTDGGLSWINTTDNMVATGVNSISANLNNPDSVLIAVQNSSNYTSHGIYKSIDGGLTWELTNFKPDNLGWGGLGSSRKTFKIVQHWSNPNIVYVGTSKGFYRSDDYLETWEQITTSGYIRDIELHPTADSIVYIYNNISSSSIPNQIMVSKDWGRTFTPSDILEGNDHARCRIATTPLEPDAVYVASSNGLWKSTDLGENFNFIIDTDESCGGLSVSDTEQGVVLMGYVDIEVSVNDGTTFSVVTDWSDTSPDSNYVHADLRTADCINGNFYIGTDGYLCVSKNNGETWTRLNNSTGIRENYRMSNSQNNQNIFVSGSQDNGTSFHFNSWIEWYGGDGMDNFIHPLNPNYMMSNTQNGGNCRSLDGGQTRNRLQNVYRGKDVAAWVSPLVLDPLNSMHSWHFAEGIEKSNDFGSTWSVYAEPLIGIIEHAEIANNDNNIIVISRDENIYLSKNKGITFNQISDGLPDYNWTDLEFDPNRDSTIVITNNKYSDNGEKIFISHDLGETWDNITFNLGNLPIRSAIIDHSLERNIYVGTEIGVYYKPMDGNFWNFVADGLPNVAVKDLQINWASNTLFAATWGRGIWSAPLVNRKSYPKITQIEISDEVTFSTPVQGSEQYVSASINYQEEISSAFIKWSVDTIDLDSIIYMEKSETGNWISHSAIDNELSSGSMVYFVVYAVGSNEDTTQSYRFNYEIKPKNYCVASGIIGDENYIKEVKINDFLNNSDGSNNSYTLFDSPIIPFTLGRNQSIEVELNSHNTNDTILGWIDLNNNGVFSEAEQIDFSEINSSNKAFASFNLPFNTLKDTVFLRLRSSRASSSFSPCETISGEVEDYKALIECEANDTMIVLSSCENTIVYEDKTYNESGIYQLNRSNLYGCDSTVNLDIRLFEPNDTTLIVQDCSPVIEVNGETYNNPGTYVQNLINVLGCDSIVNIELELLESNDTVIYISDCSTVIDFNGTTYSNPGSYAQILSNSYGCDSIINIELSLLQTSDTTISISSCSSSIEWNGEVYQNTGVYSQILVNRFGCDSIVNLDIQLLESSDTSIFIQDCSSTININGETYNNPGSYVQTLTNIYGCDSTINIELELLESGDTTILISDCSTVVDFNGITYSNPGSYAQLLTNSFGCDSIINIELSLLETSDTTISISSCSSSIEWDGELYPNPGVYTQILENQNGCDSIVNLEFEYLESSDTTINIIDCSSAVLYEGVLYQNPGVYTKYLSNSYGCDSLVYLNLERFDNHKTTIPLHSCGEPINYNGITYTESGTYEQILHDQNGCDSTLLLEVLITNINTSVIVEDNLIQSMYENGNYQWIDCKTNQILENKTSSILELEKSGIYAVIISNNNCIDTSACHEVYISSIEEHKNERITVSPNPFDQELTIKSNTIEQYIFVSLYNSLGQLVYEKLHSETSEALIQIDLSPGTYSLRVNTEGFSEVFPIIKKQ